MLLALCWLLAFTTRSWNRSGQLSAQLLAGLWFGSACIIGMLMTSVGETGIILDARTVVLSMAGLFGGPLVAAIAGTLAAAYRLWVGGPGVVPGIANILLPIALGLAYCCAYRKRLFGIGFWQLLAFGLLLHLGVLALVALMAPGDLGPAAVREIAVPVLLALPLATAILGVLLKDLLERDQIEQALRLSEARLRAIGQAIPDPLLVVDEDGRCLDVICSERNLLYGDAIRLHGKNVQEVMPEAEQQRFLVATLPPCSLPASTAASSTGQCGPASRRPAPGKARSGIGARAARSIPSG